MSLILEVAFGSLMLFLCAILHVVVIVAGVSVVRKIGDAHPFWPLGFGVLTIILAHTLQIWGWTAVLLASGALGHFETAFYFAIATYTTVGYGDVVLSEMRVFAAFASVTGMLAFGISTAFLVSLITRLLPPTWRN